MLLPSHLHHSSALQAREVSALQYGQTETCNRIKGHRPETLQALLHMLRDAPYGSHI